MSQRQSSLYSKSYLASVGGPATASDAKKRAAARAVTLKKEDKKSERIAKQGVKKTATKKTATKKTATKKTAVKKTAVKKAPVKQVDKELDPVVNSTTPEAKAPEGTEDSE